jgi:NADH-quinone oxidoreductase subunit G
MVEIRDSPKLVTACSTPAEEGMVVITDSDRVKDAQRGVMEFLLLNHPLDCPVCDQAGECELQDYSYVYGFAESRFREEKIKQRKKDAGRDLLLYADRCIMCTRCVRFAQEVSGFGQVGVYDRGARIEIDVFPGIGIDDMLAGNIADICPVGAFLSKDFLFKRRVWELTTAESVCPACSVGCNVLLDHADGEIMRLRPRHNPLVNGHWMCDVGRMGYKLAGNADRLKRPTARREEEFDEVTWADAFALAAGRWREIIDRNSPDAVGFVVSTDATNEEAFVIARLAAELGSARNLRLLPGARGRREEFVGGFVIEEDRSPNTRGVFDILKEFMAPDESDKLTDLGSLAGTRALYVLCGAHSDTDSIETLAKFAVAAECSVVQATLPSTLTAAATVVLPGAAHAEKEGTFTNSRGIVQALSPAFNPPARADNDLNIIVELAGALGVALGFCTVREASAALAREMPGHVALDRIGESGFVMPAAGAAASEKGGGA